MASMTGWVGKIAGRASPSALVAVLVLCGCCLAGEARPERAFDASYGVFIGMRGGEALRDERVLRTRVLVVDPAHFEEREIAFLKVSGHTVYGGRESTGSSSTTATSITTERAAGSSKG